MTGLDLSHVHAFVAVADAGSVSAAADQLSITQPALTRRLQKLQRDHEVQLLNAVAQAWHSPQRGGLSCPPPVTC